jgi:hypothetical protein
MEEEGAVNAHLWGSSWNEGAAEKRPGRHQMGAGNANGGHSEGSSVGMERRRGGHGGAGRESKGTAAVGSSKSPKSTNVYRILIAIVVVFFLMETIGNGLAFLRLRDTDLQTTGMVIFPRAAKQPLPAGDGARFVPRVLVERLLLSRGRATLAELRKEVRAPLRPPRLALVCIEFL